ncbi:MAG TPA: cell division protein ZapA [Myxococcota bacterium]|nr:cell division protein ZapA [Myxococcota bacterium]
MSEKRSLAVRIRGQEFRIRSDESPELLAEVAEIVDATMRRIEERTGAVDTLDVAMLTALNLAREVVEARKGRPSMPRLRALIERAEAAGSAVSH